MARSLFILIISILFARSSNGQEKVDWINSTLIETSGYYQNIGLTKVRKNIGLALKNSSNTSKQLILKINNPHINYLYLYTKKGDTLYRTGDHQNFSTRPILFWDFAFPIEVKKEHTDSLILSIDKAGENLTYFLEILTPKEFDVIKTRDTFMYGMVLSFSIIISLIFLILGIVKKQTPNIIFAAFIFISVFSILNSAGLGFQFLWPSLPWIQNFSRTLFSGLSMVAFIQYMYTVQKKNLGKVTKGFLKFCMGFFMLKVIYITFNQQIYYFANLKLVLLYINASIILSIMLILLFLLIRNIIVFKEKLNNFGLLVFFLFPFKEGLRQLGIDIEPHPEFDEYITAIYFLFPIGIISLSNIQEYRNNKKLKTIEDLEKAHKKDIEMTEKILDAQEYERSSIGKNIHDQVGGLLAVIKVKAQILKRKKQDEEVDTEIDQIINIVNVCSNELHNIVDDLVPPEFTNSNLAESIKNRIHMFQNSTEINFTFESNIENLNDQTTSLNIYRIICELTANSIKHSKCSEICIELKSQANQYLIRYYDNGVGINIGAANIKHGIKNIRSRIEFLAGKIDLNSEPGKTEYLIEIPKTQ